MTADFRAAYESGWRAQGRPADWGVALTRFERAHCTHNYATMCDAEHAWASGWSDRQAPRPKWHALNCELGIRRDHDACEPLPLTPHHSPLPTNERSHHV